MLHVRWMEEQRFWSRVDTGIKYIFSGYCKDKNFKLFSNTGKNGGPLSNYCTKSVFSPIVLKWIKLIAW